MAPSRYFAGKSSAQFGFTLMEMLVVMVIITIVLAGTAMGINRIFIQSQITTEIENIALLYHNIHKMQNTQSYTDLTNKIAYDFGMIPSNLNVDTSNPSYYTIINSWGGHVDFYPNISPKGLDIAYGKIPEQACQQFLLKLTNIGWAFIEVDNPQPYRFSASGGDIEGYTTIKPDMTSIQKACTRRDSNMFFYYFSTN